VENLEKSWNFKMVISRPGKVLEKTFYICYIHVFIYAEFDIMKCFRTKDAQNRSGRTLSYWRRNFFFLELQVNAP